MRLSSAVSLMDKDYQMLDAHVEDSFKKKVLSFEYIDFSKLVGKNKPVKEEDHQRLEIVNRNGMSYLSPVADRESVQISSYIK